jgi:hypothetical protein
MSSPPFGLRPLRAVGAVASRFTQAELLADWRARDGGPEGGGAGALVVMSGR